MDEQHRRSFAGLPYDKQNLTPGVVPSVDQRRWQACPVCFGKGVVSNGFYSTPGVATWPATSTAPERCRSCGGRGIVR